MVTDSVALPGSAFQVPLPDLPHKHVGVRLFVFGASEKGPYDHVREVFFLARMSVMNAHPQLKNGLGKPSPSMINAGGGTSGSEQGGGTQPKLEARQK